MKEDGFSLKDANLAIVGLGLMGGSLALALKGHCRRLIGLDTHPPTIEAAFAKGLVDAAGADPAALLPSADAVILAAPVPAILDWLSALPRYIRHPCVVLDIGSTKREIVRRMAGLPANFDPIGGHPICGREKLGLQNADALLYRGALFVVTPLGRTASRAHATARQIVSALGARLVELTAEEHDEIFAFTSHLPFLLASALAHSTPPQHLPFTGTGFRSAARLAGTPASMMLGVLLSNGDNLSAALERFRASLTLMETALRERDNIALERLLEQARLSYERALEASQPAEGTRG